MDRRREARTFWTVAVLFFLADGVLHFGYRHLDHVARHAPVPAIEPFIEEMTGAIAGLAVFVPVVWLVRRLPLGRDTWTRRVPAYLAAMIVTSLLHTVLMSVSRSLLWPALGLGAYDYGDMSVRYWMEMANDVVWFWVMIAILMGLEAFRRAREREVAAAELRAELARAQVQSLERRLHPHFLFNALNTISAVMYEDPAAADRMIAGLSDLLRRALRAGDAQEVPLVEELAFLDHYLEIMRARFEDKLVVDVDVDDDAKGALVPPMLLQPLVENAIRHGADPGSNAVRAALSARREGGALRLEVRDHGPGLTDGAKPTEGVGLSTTARRLATLYGGEQRLAFENADGGGLRVTIELPFHTAQIGKGALDARAPG
jgi:signal transduction histidine kinase